MKRSIVLRASFLFVLALGLFVFPHTVLAHYEKKDGNISAEMHIDPDDDPIIGQEATIHFSFTDKQGKFQQANCDCLIRIIEGASELASGALVPSSDKPSLYSTSFAVTFPKKSFYKVTVIGKSNDGSFQDFSVVFPIHVTRNPFDPPKPERHGNIYWHYIDHYGLIAVFVIVFVVLFAQGKLTFQQKKSGAGEDK